MGIVIHKGAYCEERTYPEELNSHQFFLIAINQSIKSNKKIQYGLNLVH